MTEVTVADLTQALDRTMGVFKSMTDKVMTGRVTWANIQAELTDDELAIFWSCLNIGKPKALGAAAEKMHEAMG